MSGQGIGGGDGGVVSALDGLLADPPAIVNLLVHGGTPSGDVLAATLVDLAARGYFEIESRSGGVHFLRSGNGHDASGLLPFEVRALGLVREWTRAGPVPATALALGLEGEADEWWHSFRDDVVAEARRRRYLSRWLVHVATAVLLIVGVVAFGLLVYASAHDESEVAQWVAVAVFAVFAMATYLSDAFGSWVSLSRLGHQRAAESNRIRQRLDAIGGFDPVPAGGVVVWGRYLAYAVAMGIAPDATEDLPVGPDEAAHAWVRRSGTWTRVRVRSPRWVPPGWGRRPWVAALIGLLVNAVSIVVLVAAVTSEPSEGRALVVGLAVIGIVLGTWEIFLAVADLVTSPVSTDGVVVARGSSLPRVGPWRDWFNVRYSLTVDDGVSRTLLGLRVGADDVARVARGDHVVVETTRWLRHVRTLDAV